MKRTITIPDRHDAMLAELMRTMGLSRSEVLRRGIELLAEAVNKK